MLREEDRALLTSCLGGEAGAWEGLEARYGPLLRRAAARHLAGILDGASDAEAEEVVQRVMAKLSAGGGKALASFEGRAPLAGWLCALTLREATDFARSEWRARGRARRGAPPDDDRVPTPLAEAIRREDAARLREALEGLPPRDRLLLKLAYWDDLPRGEVAAILGVAPGSVSPLLQRARAALQAGLEKGK